MSDMAHDLRLSIRLSTISFSILDFYTVTSWISLKLLFFILSIMKHLYVLINCSLLLNFLLCFSTIYFYNCTGESSIKLLTR